MFISYYLLIFIKIIFRKQFFCNLLLGIGFFNSKKERKDGLVRDVEKSKKLILSIFSKILTGENRYSPRREH